MNDIHIHSNPDIIERLDKIIELLTASARTAYAIGGTEPKDLAEQVAKRQDALSKPGAISVGYKAVWLDKGEEVINNRGADRYRPALHSLVSWETIMERLDKVEKWIDQHSDDDGHEPEPARVR